MKNKILFLGFLLFFSSCLTLPHSTINLKLKVIYFNGDSEIVEIVLKDYLDDDVSELGYISLVNGCVLANSRPVNICNVRRYEFESSKALKTFK